MRRPHGNSVTRSPCTYLPGFVLPVLLWASPALAQDRPSFEVASVRPVPEQRGRPSFDPSPRPPFARSNGQFGAGATLRHLITWAFGLQVPVEGSFRELDDVFEIAAKAPGPVLLPRPGEVGAVNQMVQSLLAERFKLRVRWGTRSLPVMCCGARRPDNRAGS